MNKKHIFFAVIFCILFATVQIFAQKDEKPKFRDKIFFGGNISLTFGSLTYIEISPRVGYRFTPSLSSGVGLIYIYYKNKTYFAGTGFPQTPFETNIYGGSVFSQFAFVKDLHNILPLGLHSQVVAHAEYEALNLDNGYLNKRIWHHNFYIGGGLNIPLGRRSYFSMLILYNLNEPDAGLLPYETNPILRFGVSF